MKPSSMKRHSSAARRRGSQLSLAEQVYESFKRDIISGVYKPGEALSENILGRRYATSRTPVREAAVRLERENLVRIVPKKGYFVKLISVSELNELYEYRALLECGAAELAAAKNHDADLLQEVGSAAVVKYEPGNFSASEIALSKARRFSIHCTESEKMPSLPTHPSGTGVSCHSA